jgi:large subunit ribosomal protein L23
MIMHNIVIRPIITEKSMAQANTGRYTFQVVKEATKYDIKKAVEALFKVNVLAIATMTKKGGTVRTGKRRVTLVRKSWKKAIVRVQEGQKIAIFEVGA